MIEQRKFLWRSIISSLVLGTLLLVACTADIPAETVPTESASQDDGITDTGSESSIEEVFGGTATSAGSGQSVSSNDISSNSNTDALPTDTEIDANGVPVGFTEAGNPYRGNPNAPVVIEEFSDFQ